MDVLVKNTSDHICEVRGKGLSKTLVLLAGVDNYVDKKEWASAKKTKFVQKRLGTVLVEGGASAVDETKSGVEL